jgi:integrase
MNPPWRRPLAYRARQHRERRGTGPHREYRAVQAWTAPNRPGALPRDPSLGRNAGVVARPRGLRHASITAALDTSNGDVRAAQAHARHANPQTTMRYGDNRQDLAGHVAAKLADALFNS